MRCKAERRFRHIGLWEHYQEQQRVRGLIRRALLKLSIKKREVFLTLGLFSSVTKVWHILCALRRPVTSMRSFRALAPSRGSSEILIADRFLATLACSGAFAVNAKLQLTTERAVQAYKEH